MDARMVKVSLVAVAAACSVLFFASRDSSAGSPATQGELVVVSYGGAYQEAQCKAFFQPFEKKYHVQIQKRSGTATLPDCERWSKAAMSVGMW